MLQVTGVDSRRIEAGINKLSATFLTRAMGVLSVSYDKILIAKAIGSTEF